MREIRSEPKLTKLISRLSSWILSSWAFKSFSLNWRSGKETDPFQSQIDSADSMKLKEKPFGLLHFVTPRTTKQHFSRNSFLVVFSLSVLCDKCLCLTTTITSLEIEHPSLDVVVKIRVLSCMKFASPDKRLKSRLYWVGGLHFTNHRTKVYTIWEGSE